MEGSGIGQFIPLILIFVIFYFFLIRPQQKKVKEHKAMVEGLKRGDKVVTSGGITGRVERLIDNDKVEVIKGTGIQSLMGTPEVTILSPFFKFSTIALCSLTFFCWGLIKKK